jgi:hypothetical protein
MKLNCIIDTCSCVYLVNAEFSQKTLLSHLNENVNINFSREVHLEIRDHKDKGLPTFLQGEKLKVVPQKFSMDAYEQRMLGKTLPSRKPSGSKGEVDNFLVSIDQAHHLKKYPAVFITDDEKAINGTLSEWLPSFPAIRVWSSFEVVLYLYAQKKIPSKDIAVEVLKALISFMGRAGERSEKFTAKLQKQLATYNKRIENISNLLN